MMLTRISCFSSTTSTPIETDSIVWVTASDLKYANLIFTEHDKLRKDNFLLLEQVDNYTKINDQLMQIDSLRISQISEYTKLNQNYLIQIENLNKEVKKKNNTLRYWQIGGVTVSVGLILLLLLK